MCVPTGSDGMWHYLVGGAGGAGGVLPFSITMSTRQPIVGALGVKELTELVGATITRPTITCLTLLSAPGGGR